MSNLDPSRYKLICEHLQIALEMPLPQRDDYLRSLELEDSALAEDVRKLIESDAQAEHDFFLNADPSHQPTFLFSDRDPSDQKQSPGNIPTQIEGYEILVQLGKGGMGTIYRAYQRAADRFVALKLINSGQFNNDEQIRRFRKEAQAAAGMQHESIIPVYDVGETDGMPYFTMAIVEGRNLKESLDGRPLDGVAAAELMLCLAEAISYAHARGVIHRDLKPSNVMIDGDGKAWLTDFGIAKRLNEDDGMTQTGQILGTASYISPEQIDQPELIGPPTDIYGLGGILYYCLTGQAPFPGNDMIQLFTDVKSRMPTPLAELNPQVDRDLAAICIRCLQKEPEARYESTQALIADLIRFRSGEPLQGTGSSWRQSLHKILKYRERSTELLSAGAARWALIAALFLHTSIFLIAWYKLPHFWLWSVLAIGTIWQTQISYRFHWSQYWQLQMVERQSGIIQLAVSLGFLSLFLIHGPLTAAQPIGNILKIYPALSIILGVATFAHAGIHSGRWLISGFLCFPVSILIACYPAIGPLLLIALSALILCQADTELRTAAKKMREQSQ